MRHRNIPKLHDCLTDKSHMEYQRLPVFPEIVTILHKFGKFFKLTPISFPEFEQALDYEAENYGVDRECWVRSRVLLKLYQELLSFFGCNVECDRIEINTTIWALLAKWSKGGVLSIDDEILRASDVYELFPEKKLNLIRIFLNAIFYADRAQRMLEDCDEDDLRVVPLFVDQNENKFWYFCDTYLYMEEPEPIAEKSPSKTERRLNAARREATQNLFTAKKLRLVCRTSEDWNQLLKMYEKNRNSTAIAKLTDLIPSIKSFENKRLREQIANVLPPRSSSRIQNKLEEKKRQEELQRIRAEEEKIRRDQAIKRLLEEQQDTENHKRAIDLVLGMNKFPDLSQSREERRLQREQKKLEQQHANSYSEKRFTVSDEVKTEPLGEGFNDRNVFVESKNVSVVNQADSTVEVMQSTSADVEQKTEAVESSDHNEIKKNCSMVERPVSTTAVNTFGPTDMNNGGVGATPNRSIYPLQTASTIEEGDDIIDIERVDDESVILPEVTETRVSDGIGDYVVVSTPDGREITPEMYYYEEDDAYRFSKKRKSHPPPKRRCYKKDVVLPINLDEMDLDAPGALGIDHLNGGMLLNRTCARMKGDSLSSNHRFSVRNESYYNLSSSCHMSPSSSISAERRSCSRNDGASNDDGNNSGVVVVDDDHHRLPSQTLNRKLSGGADYRRNGPPSHYFVKYQNSEDGGGGGGPSSSSSVSSAHQPPVLERQESVNVKPILTSLVKRRRSGDSAGGNRVMMGMSSRNVLNNGGYSTGLQQPSGTYRGSARGRGSIRGGVAKSGRGRGAGPSSMMSRDISYYGYPNVLPQSQRAKYLSLSAGPLNAYEHPKYYIGDRTRHELNHYNNNKLSTSLVGGVDNSLQCESSTNGANESLEMFVVDRNELNDCVEEVVVQASTSDFQTSKKNSYSREPPKFTASDNVWRTDSVGQVIVEHDYSLSPIFNPAHYEEVVTTMSSSDAKTQQRMASWSGGSITTNLPYHYYN